MFKKLTDKLLSSIVESAPLSENFQSLNHMKLSLEHNYRKLIASIEEKNTADSPEKSNSLTKVMFQQLTPQANDGKLLKCSDCSMETKHKRSLFRHIKNIHQKSEVPDVVIDNPSEVTCKICSKKVRQDYINSHLRDKHSIRGWTFWF